MSNGMINEVIITTLNTDGSTHMAPFGVRSRGKLVAIAPFRPSGSLDNMLRTRCAVVNCTDDVSIFAGCLTGRLDWPTREAIRVRGRVLEGALSHRELELVDVIENELRPELAFSVVHEVIHAPFSGFNRAQGAVLELAVLVSRLHLLPMEKIAAEVSYLTTAIEKTAGERERQARDWLLERIENFKAEQSGENIA